MATATRIHPQTETTEQYSLGRILGIWALAAAPMAVLSWIIYPAVSPDASVDPLGAGAARILALTAGLVWQFALTLMIVWREEGDLRWATLKRRLRLNPPRDPATGATRRRLWLWIIPFLAASVAWDVAAMPHAEKLWLALFPFLAEPPGYGFEVIFESPELLARLAGAWWFAGLFAVSAVFNTVLGEEFLFRGVLLPRMEGAFGRWAWVANGALFALYHVHQPWVIGGNVVSGILFLALPAWRFRSTWPAIIIHSAQSVFFLVLVVAVVLGLM